MKPFPPEKFFFLKTNHKISLSLAGGILLVALGAGAALSGLIATVPGLVWVSDYKEVVFGVAGLMLAGNGWLQWRNRFAPCPTDLALRQACLRTRRTSAQLYGVSLGVFAVGGWFAFGQPWLSSL